MLKQLTLAEIIQSKVALGPQNSRGFYDVKCPLCADTRPRGAFRFDSESTGYTCFHCGFKTRYQEGTGAISKKFRSLLDAFGITSDDLVSIRSSLLSDKPAKEEPISLQSLQKVKLTTPETSLPDKSHPIGSPICPELQAPLVEYLLDRKIDPVAVRAHFSLSQKLLGRVIIPFYREEKIIYWQARAVDSAVVPRYLNSPVARDAVLYGYNQLSTWSPLPLFVTEGVFDAITLGGVCTLGSSVNEAKVEILKRSSRRLIFVVDRDTAGGTFGEVALQNGWEVTFVDERARDANHSVKLFGLPFTLYTLMKNATKKPSFAAQSKLQLSMGLLLGKLRGQK